MNERTLYFAYGSNLDLIGMQHRAPTAKRIGRATLEEWRLVFRGVADVEPAPGDVVQGALWELDPDNVRALDRYEGHPHYYHQRDVIVREADGGLVKAMTYVMLPEYQKKEGLPSDHYLASIIRGYKAFGLPLDVLAAVVDRTAVEIEVAGRPWRPSTRVTDTMSPATRAFYALEEETA